MYKSIKKKKRRKISLREQNKIESLCAISLTKSWQNKSRRLTAGVPTCTGGGGVLYGKTSQPFKVKHKTHTYTRLIALRMTHRPLFWQLLQ